MLKIAGVCVLLAIWAYQPVDSKIDDEYPGYVKEDCSTFDDCDMCISFEECAFIQTGQTAFCSDNEAEVMKEAKRFATFEECDSYEASNATKTTTKAPTTPAPTTTSTPAPTTTPTTSTTPAPDHPQNQSEEKTTSSSNVGLVIAISVLGALVVVMGICMVVTQSRVYSNSANSNSKGGSRIINVHCQCHCFA